MVIMRCFFILILVKVIGENAMKKLYKLLFVYLYTLYVKFGENDVPHIYSMLLMSLITSLYLIALSNFIEMSLFKHYINNSSIFIGLSIATFNYFVFIYKKKYILILDSYKKPINKKSLILFGLFFILFFILSVISLNISLD
jgi:hypothetical protein